MARRAGRYGKRGGEKPKDGKAEKKGPGGLAGLGGKPKGQPVKKGLRKPSAPAMGAGVPMGGMGGL